MRYRLKKTVALVGMMGAGKTAIGKALANLLSVPFLDSDAEIESASNMAISEIFARDGELFFRAKETQVLARLLDNTTCVLSTGGGAFLTPQNRDLMSAKAVSLFLEVEPDLLWARVRLKTGRPLLQTPNPYETLKEMLAQRGPVYALADLTVPAAPSVSIDQMAERVLACLLERSDILEKVT
jgi:shikimate kinase